MKSVVMINPRVRVIGSCLLIIAAWVVPAVAQSKPHYDAPKIDIPESALKAVLLSGNVAMIEENVKYWADHMAKASGDAELLPARRGMLADYRKYDSIRYQDAYAEQSVKYLIPLIKSDNVLLQINAALVISQMRQVYVQPALEIMVAHPNPAVRLYGWRGYQRIRMWVLAQGKGPIDQMLGSLSKAANEGTSGPVMAAIFHMLYLEPDRPNMVSKEDFDAARERLFEIFKQVWPRQCQHVLERQIGMIRAADEGLRTLRSISDSPLGRNSAAHQAIVQMVLDMMWCSAKVYAVVDTAHPVFAPAEALLRDCESAMSFVTKLRKGLVEEALAVKTEGERHIAVQIAVQDWLRELAGEGVAVTEPKFTVTPPPNQPSTTSAPVEE